MPVTFILQILFRLQLGKINKPSVEVDRLERLTISPRKIEKTPVIKSNDKLKKTKKIVPVYVVDNNKMADAQLYKNIYDTAIKHTDDFNTAIEKQHKKSKKNRFFLYFLIISITAVALYYIYKYWKNIKEKIQILYKYIGSFFRKCGEFVWDIIVEIFYTVKKYFNKIVNYISEKIDEWISILFESFEKILKNIGEAINEFVGKVEKNFKVVYDSIMMVISKVENILSNMLETLLTPFKWLFTEVFTDKSEKDETHYQSVNLAEDKKVPEELNFNDIDKEVENFEHKYDNEFSESNGDIFKYTENIINETKQKSIKTTKKIEKTREAKDALYLDNKNKYFVKKYQKFKSYSSAYGNALDRQIETFDKNIQTNMKNWKVLFT